MASVPTESSSPFQSERLYVLINVGAGDNMVSFSRLTMQIVRAGCRLIQIRDKQRALQRRDLGKFVASLQESGITVIYNDHWRTAEAIGADGVHIGTDDEEPTLRGRCRWVGRSARTEEAVTAPAGPTHYFGIGPVATTNTKSNLPAPIGVAAVVALQHKTTLPVYAIGGINDRVAAEVLGSGVHGICVSSWVQHAPNPGDQVTKLLEICDKLA